LNKGYRADGLVCHQANKEDRLKLIKFVVDKYGGIDILMPHAGVSHNGNFLETKD
jgi:hypothetical protein